MDAQCSMPRRLRANRAPSRGLTCTQMRRRPRAAQPYEMPLSSSGQQEVVIKVHVAKSRADLGERAAHEIGEALRQGLRSKSKLRVILAAAPSQSEMLAALRHEPDIDWKRITAFHMDEYIGLPEAAPQRFAKWLKQEFIDHLPIGRFEAIDPGDDPEAVCARYAALLAEAPIDAVLLGIGTNGHLAFNDPPANLEDPLPVKVVTLTKMCREQQVLDGCFSALDEVPERAVTLTIPTLLAARELFCRSEEQTSELQSLRHLV